MQWELIIPIRLGHGKTQLLRIGLSSHLREELAREKEKEGYREAPPPKKSNKKLGGNF